MSFANIDPTKLIDHDFRIRKINWSIYDLETSTIQGTLRVMAVPINIIEVPGSLLPNGTVGRAFGLNTQGVVGFSNRGKKGASDLRPITQEEFQKGEKQDVTSFLTTRDEPFNEYILAGRPPTLLRAKTVVVKVEVLVGRTNSIGDPAIWVNHTTSLSTSEDKSAILEDR